MPRHRVLGGVLKEEMRYGENPHQKAGFYVTGENRPGVATAKLLQGKQLSYNNINDTDAAFELVAEFLPEKAPAVAIIKHANPCGVATAPTLVEAYRRALACDSTSAFGGIIALNQMLDAETAEAIVKLFTEVIIAPEVSDEAKAVIARKPNLRLLTTGALPDPRIPGLSAKTVSGGLLVQTRDNGMVEDLELKVVTKRAPTAQELEDMKFAFKVAKHVKSNAVVYAKDGQTAGIGAGQMSRVDCGPHRRDQGRRSRQGARPRNAVDARLGRRLRGFPAVCRWLAVGDRCRCHGGDPARWFDARRGSDCRGRRAWRCDGLHRYAPLPPLNRIGCIFSCYCMFP